MLYLICVHAENIFSLGITWSDGDEILLENEIITFEEDIFSWQSCFHPTTFLSSISHLNLALTLNFHSGCWYQSTFIELSDSDWAEMGMQGEKGRNQSFVGSGDGHRMSHLYFVCVTCCLRAAHNLTKTTTSSLWRYRKFPFFRILRTHWYWYMWNTDFLQLRMLCTPLLRAFAEQQTIKFYESVNCYFYCREWTWSNGGRQREEKIMLHWMRDDEEIGCWARCTLCSASNFLFYCNIAFAAHLRVASWRGKLQRIEFHHPAVFECWSVHAPKCGSFKDLENFSLITLKLLY